MDRFYRSLRESYGLQYGTLCAVRQMTLALQRDGLLFKQVQKAVKNVHPKLMSNLTVNRDGSVAVVDTRLRWVRRHEWTRAAKKCSGCGGWRYSDEFPKTVTKCAYCRHYEADCRRWARERKRMKKKT